MVKNYPNYIAFISQYEEMGYLPEALFNFISLLGWSPEGEEEILSKAEIIAQFDEKRLSKSPATFDKNKLMYINNRYIKELSLDEMVELCRPHLEKSNIIQNHSDLWIRNLVELFHGRMSYGAEIVDLYKEFFITNFMIGEEELAYIKQDGIKATLEVFQNKLRTLDDFNAENIKEIIKATGKETKAKGKMLFMPCRIAVTAQMHGPDLPRVIELLGKEKVLQRLETALSLLTD